MLYFPFCNFAAVYIIHCQSTSSTVRSQCFNIECFDNKRSALMTATCRKAQVKEGSQPPD